MTVAHASLTGANLHEPKGVATAAINTIYIADGAGSGTWTLYNTYRTTKLVKTADTSRSLTTTLTADPTLTFSVLANSKYLVRLVIFGLSSTTPDFKYRMDIPASATGNGATIIRTNNGTESETMNFSSSFDSFQTDGDGGKFYITAELYITTAGTAGNVSFMWAQNTSDATPAIVKAGSYIEYQKIS